MQYRPVHRLCHHWTYPLHLQPHQHHHRHQRLLDHTPPHDLRQPEPQGGGGGGDAEEVGVPSREEAPTVPLGEPSEHGEQREEELPALLREEVVLRQLPRRGDAADAPPPQ